MSRQDFIPRQDAAFDAFFKNLIDFVMQNAARWGHIAQGDVDAIETQYYTWAEAYRKTLVPHIPQLTQEKNRVRVTTERALRAFINRFLRWPPVTGLDRDKMGVRNWDTIHTTHPVPATIPEIEVDSSVIRVLTLRMRDHGATNWARPENVHGMEFAWGIADSRPGDTAALPHLETASSNPIILEFTEEERGSRVFFAARWLNNTMQHGHWSDIESAIVP
jgi:hypothetical protein